jgi:hypothetical protein
MICRREPPTSFGEDGRALLAERIQRVARARRAKSRPAELTFEQRLAVIALAIIVAIVAVIWVLAIAAFNGMSALGVYPLTGGQM